ncbi:DHHA1 domain-containing protein [Marinovum sp. SP66]|uniref:DHHA1 domain-containing protein n=1 Tax=Marinovum TaxID=367771 RepID=UPI00237A6952|nr:DHHA1 domain-containing protein [Marinovum sp. SP66]MDD9738468.1 DHHA1 domain-containing protein [Marinovum sp. SP66]
MTRTICIHHGNCADGFTAAWCVREALGDAVEYIPARYGSTPPDVTGADVIIVDFSYKRPVLERMALDARSILVLDHHKTAQEDLLNLPYPAGGWEAHRAVAGNPAALFDMDRSGAQMAWDYFCGGARPQLVDYVADRDLWTWKLDRSREISAVIASHDMTFDQWDEFAARMQADADLGQMADEGEAILRKHDRDVRATLNLTTRTMVIGGHKVPVANTPYSMASDAAGTLAEGNPFAAVYFDGPEGRAFSLRSRGDGLDVSEIAKKYGGGGHRNAAGFKMPIGWEGDDAAGVSAITAERKRQTEVEGWTPEHDDAHDQCELSLAGAVYALSGSADSEWRNNARIDAIRELWPFESHWFKQTGGREDLVKAGALIAAEIDRLDRANG